MKKADHDIISLTPETIKFYETRLKNECNVYTNLNYLAWLEKFHPYHLPPLGMLMLVVTCLSHVTVKIYAYKLALIFVLQMYC